MGKAFTIPLAAPIEISLCEGAECYDPPYSSLFVPSYSGVRQEESPTL